MNVATEAQGGIPEDLLGRGYMCQTPAVQTTWHRLREEIPASLHPQLADSCFVLLKPDILASGKYEMLWDCLLAVGAQPLVAWACLQSGLKEFEELYKFNLTLSNDQCMLSAWWLHSRPYRMGPVVCLLVRVAKDVRGDLSACDFISKHKGPSNPFLAISGQWRHDIVSTNMALNLVHTADDPISTAREFRIFGTAECFQRALVRCQMLARGAAEEEVVLAVGAEFRTAVDLVGYPHHDLDLVSNLVRVKLRLAQAIDSGAWMPTDLVERYGALLRVGGTARERWHTYESYCGAEEKKYGSGSRPEVLERLARTSEYRFELADLLEGEVHKYRLPYSEWERVVIETTLFFHKHLPTNLR